MKFHYISPSILPSQTANSVHVVMQCAALIRAGAHVTLFAKRAVADQGEFGQAFRKAYGVEYLQRIVTYFSESNRGENLRIAFLALAHLLRGPWPDAILSRNLYAAFVIGVLLRRPLIFETHQLETGVRKPIQSAIMTRPWVTTLVISNKLLEYIEKHHGKKPNRSLVLHDAAPDGIEPISPDKRRSVLTQTTPLATGKWEAVCGYFGHLYSGRGIEIIEAMAVARPSVLFLIYGGNEGDVQARSAANSLQNLYYMGHIPHPEAQKVMGAVDVLLMPYQESVSIGVTGHDTAKWMSPMKMFEYMASGVPLIASDLPVLCEVLQDGENALLVPPNNTKAWISALDRLLGDENLAKTVGTRAHNDYKENYTWNQRASRILESARAL